MENSKHEHYYVVRKYTKKVTSRKLLWEVLSVPFANERDANTFLSAERMSRDKKEELFVMKGAYLT